MKKNFNTSKSKSEPKKNFGAGKGDEPRNIFSEKYRKNYDGISWKTKKNFQKKINE
jgi:hypothetical protein